MNEIWQIDFGIDAKRYCKKDTCWHSVREHRITLVLRHNNGNLTVTRLSSCSLALVEHLFLGFCVTFTQSTTWPMQWTHTLFTDSLSEHDSTRYCTIEQDDAQHYHAKTAGKSEVNFYRFPVVSRDHALSGPFQNPRPL